MTALKQGLTVHEIAAISGHASLKEVERYTTKAADQMRLARAAMARTAAQKGVAKHTS